MHDTDGLVLAQSVNAYDLTNSEANGRCLLLTQIMLTVSGLFCERETGFSATALINLLAKVLDTSKTQCTCCS